MSAAIVRQLQRIRQGSRSLRKPSEKKNEVLLSLAHDLVAEQDLILKKNRKDLMAVGKEATTAFIDRLTLNEKRLMQMADSLRAVAALSDPVGEVTSEKILNNGLVLKKVRSPFGVIFMVFESRPNVALEAFSLGFKAGNAMILRGGKESQNTVGVFYKLIHRSLKNAGLDPHILWGITDSDRRIPKFLFKQNQWIDLVVPRGGDQLIKTVVRESTIPIIKNDRGLCHVYVHQDADVTMAIDIIVNAKTQRPGVCNSMETLLVHQEIADRLLPDLHSTFSNLKVRWFGCSRTLKVLKGKNDVKPAKVHSFATEYLDLVMNCKIVRDLPEALGHIEKYGSHHSESIITSSAETARAFQEDVDAAAVYWNASTRFTDGFEFGLGGELGISTQKLHARGPVGLNELTSLRWVIDGQGQIRV